MPVRPDPTAQSGFTGVDDSEDEIPVDVAQLPSESHDNVSPENATHHDETVGSGCTPTETPLARHLRTECVGHTATPASLLLSSVRMHQPSEKIPFPHHSLPILSRLELQLLSRGLEFLISSLTLLAFHRDMHPCSSCATNTLGPAAPQARQLQWPGRLSSAAASSDPFGSSFRFYAPAW